MSAAGEMAENSVQRCAWWQRLFGGGELAGRAGAHELNILVRKKRRIIALCEHFLDGPHYAWARPTVNALMASEQAAIARLEAAIRDAGGFPTSDAAPLPASRTQLHKLSAAWEMLHEEIDSYHALLRRSDDRHEKVRRLLRLLLEEEERWAEELKVLLMKT